MEKSAVFIDAGNVIKGWYYHCRKNNLGDKIDYSKLVSLLTDNTNFLRAYFYDGIPEKLSIRKKRFLEALQHRGIQLRTKILKNRYTECEFCHKGKNRQIQKGVDVSLATDILRHGLQKSCDICIVVSGDEDFKDAMDLVKDRGLKVWVCSFRNSLSAEVRKTADRVVLIDDIFDSVKQA